MNLFPSLIWYLLLVQINSVKCSTSESEATTTLNVEDASVSSSSSSSSFSTTQSNVIPTTAAATTIKSKANETKRVNGSELITKNISDDYMKQLDIYHIDDKCQMARFGYYQNFYEFSKYSGGNGSDTDADLLEPESDECSSKDRAMLVSDEGKHYYDIRLINDSKTPLSISSFKILYFGSPKEISDLSISPEIYGNGDWDLSTCFEDLGSLYCLRTFQTNQKEYFFYRFISVGQKFVISSILNFDAFSTPQNILQDSQSGHIAIVYKNFNGFQAQQFDYRSIYELGKRGKLVRPIFSIQHTLGVASHNQYRFFVVNPKHSESDSKTNSTLCNYTFYRTPTSYATVFNQTDSTNWEALNKRNAQRIKMFFKNDISELFPLAKYTAKFCEELVKATDACESNKSYHKDIQIAMITVTSFLLVIFILFFTLLMVYLFYFITPKRIFGKRKTRKASTSKLSKNGETVALLGKKENEKKKKEDNKVVKQLKEFGGVDYSSSSEEEDLEKNHPKGSGASPSPSRGSQPGGKTNQNNENPGLMLAPPPPAATTDDTAVVGNGIEEHNMEDKFDQYVMKGPRSAYLSPEKKK